MEVHSYWEVLGKIQFPLFTLVKHDFDLHLQVW